MTNSSKSVSIKEKEKNFKMTAVKNLLNRKKLSKDVKKWNFKNLSNLKKAMIFAKKVNYQNLLNCQKIAKKNCQNLPCFKPPNFTPQLAKSHVFSLTKIFPNPV